MKKALITVDWTKINGTRSDLLSQASSWEGRNDQLYNDGLQLDRDKQTLDRRVGEFNAEVGRYNQACTTRPLPPDEYLRCVAWRDSLSGRQAQLENDIRNHNSRVNSWNQRSQAIFDQRRTIISNIENWEAWIQNWIETVKKAMAAVCRPVVRLDSIPADGSVFSGGFSVPFQVRAFHKTEPQDAPPCPVSYQWSMEVHPPIRALLARSLL